MIALSMNRTDYENDIRSLLMAFFYGEKIVMGKNGMSAWMFGIQKIIPLWY